jgi:hypothetical protein
VQYEIISFICGRRGADFNTLEQVGSDLHLTFGHLPPGLLASHLEVRIRGLGGH